jgi:2-oxoglutarate dehydrogenase E2 component (dihydrolipoamide succinyltransferase)
VSNVVVPQLGESVVEARVGKWLKKVGDAVSPGEPLVELETDKIDLEVGAEHGGVLARIDRQEGDDVKVGELLAVVDTSENAQPAAPAQPGTPAGEAPGRADGRAGLQPGPSTDVGPGLQPRPTSEVSEPRPTGEPADIRATATARRMADEHGVDLSAVKGTGEGGRVTKEDVQKYVSSGAQRPVLGGAGLSPAAAQTAAPAAQPLRAVPPPQSTGAATRTDVGAGLQPRPTSVPPGGAGLQPGRTVRTDVGPGLQPRPAGDRTEERVRMSKRRATIAARLVEAQHAAAMLTTFNEVDMSAVMALRARRKEAFQKRFGVNLGLMSFFVKASVGALRAFPRLNAEVDGDVMVLKHYYDVGIAVGASGGLVVPVLRNADVLSFADIEGQIRDFARRADDGTLSLEEIRGGTFTITNGGVFGSLLSTPILNPPQVGILGMHKIEERPIAQNGQVVVKPMMYVALSYDHRIVDGLEAVQFLVKVKELIEDPGQMLIEL